MGELELTALLCAFVLGADPEVKKGFLNQERQRSIRIDCETPTMVIEVGLDKTARARDSVHQAVFASILTGKTPAVVVIDRDRFEGRYEQELRAVTKRLGIPFAVCRASFLQRWASTQPWRILRYDQKLGDLPRNTAARQLCDLSELLIDGP